MEGLWQDIRYALRISAANPGFTLVAIVTLALSIGANTAVFSAVHGIILKPLPIRDPDRVAIIYQKKPTGDRNSVSAHTFLAFREQNRSFSTLACYSSAWMNITGDGEPQQLLGMRITAEFLPLFGVEPMLGRVFSRQEDRSGAQPVALLSYNFWRHRYAADPGILNRTIILNGVQHAVIGVLPKSFRLYNQDPEVWVPLALNPSGPVGVYALVVFGRLKPDASLELARRDLEGLASNLETLYPESNKGWGVLLQSYPDEMSENARFGLFTMLGAVSVVLLIACCNVASLLLARSAVRRREVAIRIALGAGRGRIVRQLLTESLVLSLAGAAAGVGLAWLGLRYLVASSPAAFPRLFEVAVDGRVLAFSLALSFVTAVLFGIVPAREFATADIYRSLKEGGRSETRSAASVARKALLIGELALSVVLVIAAVFLTRSFFQLQFTDRGFRPERVLTFQLNMPARRYQGPAEMTAYLEEMLRRIGQVPGVEAAGANAGLPIERQHFVGNRYTVDTGPTVSGTQRPTSVIHLVSTGYFEALRIPILQGRPFNQHDRSLNPSVAIVSQSFARRWWPGENAIGHTILVAGNTNESAIRREVVGIAGDILYPTAKTASSIEMYLPYLQTPFPTVALLVRTHTDPLRLAPAVLAAIRSIDKDQAINYLDTLQGRIAEVNGSSRWYTLMLGSFAVIALLLSTIGIYGVISYSTARRTREIGVRMALGALPVDILGMILGEAVLLAGVGLAAGLAIYLLAARLLVKLVYGIAPTDASTIASVLILLGAVAVVAAWIPARRATRLDPSRALRDE